MKNIRKGNIYYCQLDKKRPCVVISSNSNNSCNSNVMVVPVSDRLKRLDLATHVILSRQVRGRTAMAMVEFIYTVKENRLENYAGHVTEGDMMNINNALRHVLAIYG